MTWGGFILGDKYELELVLFSSKNTIIEDQQYNIENNELDVTEARINELLGQ